MAADEDADVIAAKLMLVVISCFEKPDFKKIHVAFLHTTTPIPSDSWCHRWLSVWDTADNKGQIRNIFRVCNVSSGRLLS